MRELIINYIRSAKGEKGFTLLEYCAGAAVLIAIVWVALNTLGTDLGAFLEAVGNWAKRQADIVNGK